MTKRGKSQNDKIISDLKAIWKSIVRICLAVTFVFLIIILGAQKYIFFHPWNDAPSYEQLKTISDFEEVNIISDGKNLIFLWRKNEPLQYYFLCY